MTEATPTQLPIAQLQPNPLQPRGKIHKEHLDELVVSIKAYGILEPIVVAQTPAGYQIIAGERRWRAAKVAGLHDVPVIVKQTSPKGMLEMALIENVQRVDLSALERAQAFQQLIRDFRFTQQQIADRIGKSMSYVSNTLRLLSLPDAIKDGLSGGQISEGHARALAGLENEHLLIDCYKQVLRENASVRRTEELVRTYKERVEMPVATNKGQRVMKGPEVEYLQKSLSRVFSEKAKVKILMSSRQTKLSVTYKGTPEEAREAFEKIVAWSEKSQEE